MGSAVKGGITLAIYIAIGITDAALGQPIIRRGNFRPLPGLSVDASARSARLASRCSPAAVSHTKAVIGRYVIASMWLPLGGGS